LQDEIFFIGYAVLPGINGQRKDWEISTAGGATGYQKRYAVTVLSLSRSMGKG
jgi:hypothetical protein